MNAKGGKVRGRRPGNGSTRDDILVAARGEFEEKGYDSATVRAIAARAEVDPAMIHHFFGNKEKLFLAAVDVPFDPATIAETVTSGRRDQLGERAVRTFLGVWEHQHVRGPLLALLRSAMTNRAAAAMLRQFVTRALLGRVVPALDDLPDAELRAEALVSHLIGMGILRYVVQVEPLASASEDELVALIGPVIQHYISDVEPSDGS
ncbi:TetR/AcrR family transcriptional regulator [Phytoactinopolyspora halotolerans]|uniref:TetR/AcrR family transcriptional regulator n=1 Tax=Phytoactinopolyspora halotolerans TaxID=1981512 RepID=A0A6L9S6S0_9ACTN|nr:TetR family transcriptional regulator [Phytoactinopolyspora halotolerans]NEE00354.1 TetR/AcrR family transcriptional regulator [Phytoactinopolyspora halotolerans]